MYLFKDIPLEYCKNDLRNSYGSYCIHHYRDFLTSFFMCIRFQKSGNSSVVESQAAKRQKLEGGHLCKVRNSM